MSDISFVYYYNERKIKLLSYEEAYRDKPKDSIHTATINPAVFIEYLFSLSDEEIVKEIRNLSNRKK